MIAFRPATIQGMGERMRSAHSAGQPVGLLDLSRLDRVIQHVPEDMTVRVEAGVSFGALQRTLAAHGQWIPVDPFDADRLTVEEMLANDVSGPRRCGFGPARDHVIGMQVVVGDGRLIKSGGQVVKNVAGYDLMKLFIGARRSLGIIVEASFKLLPLPEIESIFSAETSSVDEASALLEAVHASALTPIILDAHGAGRDKGPTLVVGIAGSREDTAWQTDELRRLGPFLASDLRYESEFWSTVSRDRLARVSVRPSETMDAIRQTAGVRYVARAGNGMIYFEGGQPRAKTTDPVLAALSARVKQTYDPRGILPALPA
ncbi:MAG: FAD-binding oxidoreductase [Verrucomicrobia bacterium]|nr:FAD-binding oxidoreductase [Verrucomicrobiota bacterium]